MHCAVALVCEEHRILRECKITSDTKCANGSVCNATALRAVCGDILFGGLAELGGLGGLGGLGKHAPVT